MGRGLTIPAVRIRIITLFPEMFDGPFASSIVGRAKARGLVEISVIQLRNYAHDRHRTVDDTPYGGGPGMVLMAQPLTEAVEAAANMEGSTGRPRPKVVLMTPQGKPLTQPFLRGLADEAALTIVCGHYEGVDERFIERSVDYEVSVGDYVLTGGEIPAMAVVDGLVRLMPGALGDVESATRESFGPEIEGMLQGPVYTRPLEFEGREVPAVLLSGDHKKVQAWRRQQAVERTRARRRELLDGWPEREARP